jgi:hypothetical protein
MKVAWRRAVATAGILAVVLGLVAASRLRARTAADEFIGPNLRAQLPFFHILPSYWGLRTRDEGPAGWRWIVRYGGAFHDPGIRVEVTAFGSVSGCNAKELQELIGVPRAERMRKIDQWIARKTGRPGH